MNVDIIILAAGQGKRMQSSLPKVLQPLGGKPLLQHVIDTCSKLEKVKLHIVVGGQKKLIQSSISAPKSTNWVVQKNQLGTGHAVKQVLPSLRPNSCSVVLYGDGPLVKLKTLKRLISNITKDNLSLLTFEAASPKGLGRIIRQGPRVIGIVEEKDATNAEKKIKEVNSGILATSSRNLKNWLPKLKNNNAAKEYYLTDIVSFCNLENKKIKAINLGESNELLGANDSQELQILERIYQKEMANSFLENGVKFADVNRVDFRGEISIGKNVFIDINVILEGNVSIAKDCSISAGSIIKDSQLGTEVKVKPYSVIENSKIGNNSSIGPFAHVGPGAELDKKVEVGNFVEVKRSKISQKTKAKHLAYIGDGIIESDVNIGAGTIFVNYDGKNKNKTRVGSKAFIGSNSSLIAPIVVGKNSMIGAGSVITKSIPENKLALGRSKQRNIAKK
ncbi:MAG: bifunctional UDP-N-acetylglucosamine diphosphorylase/glucosamine-1-phosphate N-acetyltransferase GlmU [Gammaproteobacteria bacterium]